MSESLNQISLIGNLGADPELKQTNGGPVLHLRLATTEKWKTQDGEAKEQTYWHRCVVWGKRAEALAKILRKGEKVFVQGRSEPRQYETKDGTKGFSCDVNVKEVVLLGGRRGDAGKPQAEPTPPTDFGGTGGNDDEIPF